MDDYVAQQVDGTIMADTQHDLLLGRTDRAEEAAELLARLQAELADRPREALEQIRDSVGRMRRSGRRARPIEQASWDAALDLILALAEAGLS